MWTQICLSLLYSGLINFQSSLIMSSHWYAGIHQIANHHSPKKSYRHIILSHPVEFSRYKCIILHSIISFSESISSFRSETRWYHHYEVSILFSSLGNFHSLCISAWDVRPKIMLSFRILLPCHVYTTRSCATLAKPTSQVSAHNK